MNIKELIAKWEDDAELFDTNSDNEEVNITRKTEKAMLHICIYDLKQCLADCKAEVDNRITMLKFKMNKGSINPNIEYFRGKIFSLEQAKKIYGGEK